QIEENDVGPTSGGEIEPLAPTLRLEHHEAELHEHSAQDVARDFVVIDDQRAPLGLDAGELVERREEPASICGLERECVRAESASALLVLDHRHHDDRNARAEVAPDLFEKGPAGLGFEE